MIECPLGKAGKPIAPTPGKHHAHCSLSGFVILNLLGRIDTITLHCDSAILDKKLIYIPSSHFSGLAANFTYLPPLLVSKPTTHLIYIPPACFQTNNTSYIHTPPLRSVVMQHNMQDATPPITLFTPYECMQIWPIWSRLVWYMTNI